MSKSIQNEYLNRPTPLEALNNIKNLFIGSPINPTQQLEIIETSLKDTEKLKKCYKNELKNVSYYNYLAVKYKKALEIIKEKRVDVALLFYVSNADMYNKAKQFYNHHKLTQEEFELLKEVLNCYEIR